MRDWRRGSGLVGLGVDWEECILWDRVEDGMMGMLWRRVRVGVEGAEAVVLALMAVGSGG